MRASVLSILLLVLFACFAAPVLAWEKEDFAIFDLHDKLVKVKGEKGASGKRIDFYQVLDVPRTATPIQLSRAYRKSSLELHPDKNPEPEAAALY
ncbi:DnaJ sub C member 1, partial [Rhizoclosmatium hyalinum]